MSDAAAFVRVAFPIPVNTTYWYRNAKDDKEKHDKEKHDKGKAAHVGFRVSAELGRRSLVGYVVEESGTCPVDAEKVKPIGRTVDSSSLFGPTTLDVARWLSSMYFCSLGEALGTMLPSGRRESPQPSTEIEDFEIEDHALVLSGEQAKALDLIMSEPAGTTYLYGRTGTGKTEVFLQAAERTLAEGRSVIYLVPEIALTGQVVRAARKRFGAACAVIHSRLTPSEKLAEWRRIQSGEARMVIGARSAVFAPTASLGLIVIDEEHEGSYKAGNAPRYHARQAGMFRAAHEKARLVLGSATPSVEAWQSCKTGAMRFATLSERLGGGAFPSVELVDMRAESSAISPRLAQVLRETKAAGRQSILFLNRRGFSHFFSCNTCGAELLCKHCSVPLTYHKEQNQLVCHYCGYRTAPPVACPECGSLDVGWKGFGTERVEEELFTQFPDWRIARMDADTVGKRGSLEKILADFRAGQYDILLGTQMVAKGLNFPGVQTVGVIMADAGLNLPDFRASERVFSLLVQVSGRAGRADNQGRVLIQTFRPDNPVIRLAAARDIESFYARELEMRRDQDFPPFSRMVRIVVRSRDKAKAQDAARQLAHLADSKGLVGGGVSPRGVELLGPAECALSMVASSYRFQILLRARSLSLVHATTTALLGAFKPPASVHVEVDVDPVQLL